MKWGITEDEFTAIGQPPSLLPKDRDDGFIGSVLSYGFNDFFDCLQMFCSNDTLGLGIGNVDRNYPMFGIPTLRFQ